jgi:hypothetical protein
MIAYWREDNPDRKDDRAIWLKSLLIRTLYLSAIVMPAILGIGLEHMQDWTLAQVLSDPRTYVLMFVMTFIHDGANDLEVEPSCDRRGIKRTLD